MLISIRSRGNHTEELWEYGSCQRFTHYPPRLRRCGLNRKPTRGWGYRGSWFLPSQMTASPTSVNNLFLFTDSLRPEQRGVPMHDLKHASTVPINIAIGE